MDLTYFLQDLDKVTYITVKGEFHRKKILKLSEWFSNNEM